MALKIHRTAFGFCLALTAHWAVAAAAPAVDCDEPIADPQGNAIFTCHGLSAEQVQALPSVSSFLQKWLRSGLDGSRLDARSDDVLNLLHGAAAPKGGTDAGPKVEAPGTAAPAKEVITHDYRGY